MAFIRAKKRHLYVPVVLIEPQNLNKPALGYDILSSPLRKEAIESAMASRKPQATKPITLVQDSGKQQGILFLDPMQSRNGEIQRFAVVVLRMGDLIQSIFPDNEPRMTSGFRWRLSTEEGEILATHGIEDRLDEQSTITNPITFGGKQWLLSLTPTRQAIASASTTLPQQLLMACLVAVLANQAFFLMATGRDVERESIARINEDLARHDPLTNLVNRRALQEELQRVLEESTSSEQSHSLLYIDLDHFKQINDQEGHDAGDKVLQSVCKQVDKITRKSDTFTRIGGGKFAVKLKNCSISKAEEFGKKFSHQSEKKTTNLMTKPTRLMPALGSSRSTLMARSTASKNYSTKLTRLAIWPNVRAGTAL